MNNNNKFKSRHANAFDFCYLCDFNAESLQKHTNTHKFICFSVRPQNQHTRHEKLKQKKIQIEKQKFNIPIIFDLDTKNSEKITQSSAEARKTKISKAICSKYDGMECERKKEKKRLPKLFKKLLKAS